MLIGAVRDDAGDGHEDAVIGVEWVAEDIGEDTDVLHLGQGVLNDDADAGEQGVVQFLLRRERMGFAPLTGGSALT